MNYTLEPEIEDLLSTPYPKALSELREFISDLQTHLFRIRKNLAVAEMKLSQKRAQYLQPTDKGITELDRKTNIESICREEIYVVNYLTSMESTLSEKASVGVSLLRVTD